MKNCTLNVMEYVEENKYSRCFHEENKQRQLRRTLLESKRLDDNYANIQQLKGQLWANLISL